jgi:RNA polymerase-binding transcription factor DksA
MPEPASVPGAEQEIEVDLAAFLPDGVVFGDPDDSATDQDEDGTEVEDDEVLADGVVVEETVVEEAVIEAPTPEQAPAVDLEALSQIERDLDAVDAAIAALDAGTYGLDPATGQPIDDALLAENPTRLS